MGDGSSRVLIVDDDRSMLQATAERVRECGYLAVVASTWSDALKAFRTTTPDIVLLDVMMPTLDGFKLARMLKQEAGQRFVPIILITALEDVESKRRAMAAGADDFLSKPVGALELEIRLRSMLRIKELTDETHRMAARLAEIAVTDPLTGLYNRRALYEHLEREFSRSTRYDSSFAVLIMDIDFFKRVNDELGHAVGDRVLVAVAAALKETIRTTDIVGRYGGEEFLVIAPQTESASAMELADRLRDRVTRATETDPGLPRVTMSIGVAATDIVRPGHYEQLIQLADEALYEAKRAGRDRSAVATPH